MSLAAKTGGLISFARAGARSGASAGLRAAASVAQLQAGLGLVFGAGTAFRAGKIALLAVLEWFALAPSSQPQWFRCKVYPSGSGSFAATILERCHR